MISINEKIIILDNVVSELQINKGYVLSYIDMINNGMEDPDSSLEQNFNRLDSIEKKIKALENERVLLELQQ